MKNLKRLKDLSGFTLVELMIVVAIIAILAAIAIPMYSKYVKKSRTSEAVSNLGSIALYEETYFSENDRYQTAGNNPAAVGTYGNRTKFDSTVAGWSSLGNVIPNNTPLYFQYQITAGQVDSATNDVGGNSLIGWSAQQGSPNNVGSTWCTNSTFAGINASSLVIQNPKLANSNWFWATAVGDQDGDKNCSLFIKVIDRPDVTIEQDIE